MNFLKVLFINCQRMTFLRRIRHFEITLEQLPHHIKWIHPKKTWLCHVLALISENLIAKFSWCFLNEQVCKQIAGNVKVIESIVACCYFGQLLIKQLDIYFQNVGRLPEYLEDALKAAYKRYMTYLDSFGPDEAYLRKKVESELGTKMIHLKMRCSGIGSEWGKVNYFWI